MDSTAPRIIAALSAITAVSFTALALRFYCKGIYNKLIGWDDWLVALAWVCLLAYTLLTSISCRYGIGQHLSEISKEELPTGLMLLYIGRFFGIIALCTSKSSFAVTLLRLAVAKWQTCVLWFIILSLNISLGLCALFLFVQCDPVEKAWNLSTPGTCWPQSVTIGFSIFAGAYSAAMDFALALFPWVLIWKVQMRRVEKLGVAFGMSLGVLAGISATIKTSYLTGTSRQKDFTYSSADLLIWSGSETAVTIVAASIPFLRLMIKDASRKASRRQYNSRYNFETPSLSNSARPRTGTVTRSKHAAADDGAVKQDDMSDRSIILGEDGRKGDGVVVVKEFRVNSSYGSHHRVGSQTDISAQQV